VRSANTPHSDLNKVAVERTLNGLTPQHGPGWLARRTDCEHRVKCHISEDEAVPRQWRRPDASRRAIVLDQTLIVLANDPTTARELVERAQGFRMDRIEFIREYPQLKGTRHAVIARISSPTPMRV